MYDNGVKAIFTAAAGVNIGVITEAKTRVARARSRVIGVDSDQYDDGIYEGNKSVVLTSAIKKIGKQLTNNRRWNKWWIPRWSSIKIWC